MYAAFNYCSTNKIAIATYIVTICSIKLLWDKISTILGEHPEA